MFIGILCKSNRLFVYTLEKVVELENLFKTSLKKRDWAFDLGCFDLIFWDKIKCHI